MEGELITKQWMQRCENIAYNQFNICARNQISEKKRNVLNHTQLRKILMHRQVVKYF